MSRKKEKIKEKTVDKKKEKKKAKETGGIREYVDMILEVLVLVFFINAFLLQSQAIPTPSMVDTMLIGDHLLVDKVALSPSLGKWDRFLYPHLDIERGMIITFKGPAEMEKDYVKRVIALPGETIFIRDKKVYINTKPIEEPYLYFEGEYKEDFGDNFPLVTARIIDQIGNKSYLPFYMKDAEGRLDYHASAKLCKRFDKCVTWDETLQTRVFKVPAGHYFCMGDNRDNSYDSRFWGPVPEEYIIGKPWRIYWSYESTTDEYLNPGLLHKIKSLFKTVINFVGKTRWNRTFMKFE